MRQLTLTAPVAAADRLRLRLLRATAPLSTALIRDRELRVAVGATGTVLGALLLTLFVPFWALALGPLILGVPHLLSDVRYLVVRPGYHRRPELWLACGVPVAAAGLGAGTAMGLCAAVGAFAVAEGPLPRRLLGGAVAVALVLAAGWASATADATLAQAHNLVAIVLWLAWRQRRRWLHWVPTGAALLGALALGLGWLDPVLAATGALGGRFSAFRYPVQGAWGMRALLVFAFAQSVHYGIWLRAIPDEDRVFPTPRTFRATLRALRADLGGLPLLGVVAVAVGLGAWALVDVQSARDGYLRLALFHGFMELSVLALWIAEGRRGVIGAM